ncbi:hypothetical protein ABFS83_08G160100 [Erythranthe nasuta]
MEVKNVSSSIITNNNNNKELEEDDVQLPGFRFHPTDEELVGFYLKRKIEKRPIRIELIKQADIYKYDPWDLPKSSGVGDDKEWYFFCKRGRKYRNSTRPNRVTGTGSGFWKATGIDKPVYSGDKCIIGLKKSLVYYRGSAGKGTKTDWMMHEFRLPASHDGKTTTKNGVTKNFAQEAEVWTLCRILKRNVTYKKCAQDLREVAANKNTIINNNNIPIINSNYSKTCSNSIYSSNQNSQICYNIINFNAQINNNYNYNNPNYYQQRDFPGRNFLSSTPSLSSSVDIISDEFLRRADWEDLRSVVECAAALSPYVTKNSNSA